MRRSILAMAAAAGMMYGACICSRSTNSSLFGSGKITFYWHYHQLPCDIAPGDDAIRTVPFDTDFTVN